MMLDVNKRVYNHKPGPCRKVEGVEHGSEDIALIEDEGIAFITSGIFYMSPRGKNVKGQILLYDFKQKNTWKATPLRINGNHDQESIELFLGSTTKLILVSPPISTFVTFRHLTEKLFMDVGEK
ncbi:hypothetical protein DICVIV_11020 [Dictyocaulus viviparus]|uniref:Uncharacterized protein n=1 Tax=Dictyocaulus viviparus TaxID=29172 RepID=A0A0D8XKV6_DICVI|nr:hypothetical protein DICVIV_11020 [Dictyocaulus viviparus]